ncbi:conserved hypothetical protein [Hyphomicrobiales bacterium]|nr:conserved hypothetical protein [Hyphomicrobiales bacterium]CAH1700859.1 conserved hypothetical protein [Hyphomicrobiales bacterium]CAI0344734.1 DUF1214 domain-containing protein [Hyphomicrobiales bacterium]
MRIFDLAYILALGAGLGLGTAHWAVAGRPALGKVEVGAWEAWPRSGGRDIDPYMRAHLARGVHLPLGSGEGLELIAERDDGGQPLDGRCRYGLSGITPTARGWTLGVTDPDGLPFRLPLERASFTDSEIVRPEDGQLSMTASATPEPGNWLPLPASGRFQFRLRLYDTPISSQTGETRAANLPRIARLDCR